MISVHNVTQNEDKQGWTAEVQELNLEVLHIQIYGYLFS